MKGLRAPLVPVYRAFTEHLVRRYNKSMTHRWLFSFLRPLMLAPVCAIPIGCARYEYDLVQPPEFAGHIGEQADVVVDRPPFRYRLRSYQNHLVIQIASISDRPIMLLGSQSTLVDPHGQSHPLASLTIAPSSFIKFVLPPEPPEPAPTGPSIGIGVGTGVGFGTGVGVEESLAAPLPPREPPEYASDRVYWTWDGGDVRITFAFQEGHAEPFAQAFVFRQRKM